jgi:hypothetical protein
MNKWKGGGKNKTKKIVLHPPIHCQPYRPFSAADSLLRPLGMCGSALGMYELIDDLCVCDWLIVFLFMKMFFVFHFFFLDI